VQETDTECCCERDNQIHWRKSQPITAMASILIPRNMPASMATSLSRALTSSRKQSPLSVYLSLLLQYISWTADDSLPLEMVLRRLNALNVGNGQHLLELFSLDTIFQYQGIEQGVAATDVYSAIDAAQAWKSWLESNATSVGSVHVQAKDLLKNVLADEALNATLLKKVHKITGLKPSVPTSLKSVPPVKTFASTEEATSFLVQLMGTPPLDLGAMASVRELTPESESQAESVLSVFEPVDAYNAIQRLGPALPGESNQQLSRLLESMMRESGTRSLLPAISPDALAPLYSRFPHFKEVLDFIADNLLLSACGTGVPFLRLPPMLFRGSAGTGKSYFCQELTKVLGAPFVERDLSVVTEAFVLSGMSSSWKGSKSGVVFDTLVHGSYANPVICLNEVDKVKQTGVHNSPMSALYGLLEPGTSVNFTDEFAEIAINASHVVWLLTANEEGPIPAPIQSRLEIFEIREPSPAECKIIAQSVWDNLSSSQLPKGHGFQDVLSPETLEVMSHITPRVMTKVLLIAACTAVRDGRKFVLPGDVLRAQVRYGSAPKQKIGFC
jgi:ATP-dependent Lon protease